MGTKDKMWIVKVDASLLTPEERLLKKIFIKFPKLTLAQAKAALKKADGKLKNVKRPVAKKKPTAPKKEAVAKPKAKPKKKKE